jgi:HAD superfamily hydrolase (TIGR01509 family)
MKKFEALLFDCDGVLVDSERITNGVLRHMLGELGWQLSAQACMKLFIGRLLSDHRELIESNTGVPMTQAWLDEFRERRNVALEKSLETIPYIEGTLQKLAAIYGANMACASGADRKKVELQLIKTGLMSYFEGRIFSGHEMPRSKPAPDVYLAAAAALGVDPKRCAVIEDTPAGTTAGVAAGATVFAYFPPETVHIEAQALLSVGAKALFHDMRDLPTLLESL